MEYQSLKKLKRMDLLEMLIAQVEENERLLEKMEQLHFQLERQKTLSPREAGASASAASAPGLAAFAQGRVMGRSQGFAGSAGYAGSAGSMASVGSVGSMLGGSAASAPSPGSASYVGSMASAGSDRAMASKSSAGSSAAVGLTGSAGSLRSTSGMKTQQGFTAENQGSLSSVAPYAAGSPYKSVSYASTAQSDPYAPASQANSYAQTPSNASASRLDSYAPASQVNSYAQTPSNASASRLDPYAPASQVASNAAVTQSDTYASESSYYASAAKTTPPNPQQVPLSHHSCRRENTDPYEPFAPASPKVAAAASLIDPYTLDDQLAPYAAEHEPLVPSRATQPDRPREELNHPDLLHEENYARQPLTFASRQGRVHPLPLETGSGYTASAADKVNRSHA